jgi:hypothetical protein
MNIKVISKSSTKLTFMLLKIIYVLQKIVGHYKKVEYYDKHKLSNILKKFIKFMK